MNQLTRCYRYFLGYSLGYFLVYLLLLFLIMFLAPGSCYGADTGIMRPDALDTGGKLLLKAKKFLQDVVLPGAGLGAVGAAAICSVLDMTKAKTYCYYGAIAMLGPCGLMKLIGL